jgi:hypothetical protein
MRRRRTGASPHRYSEDDARIVTDQFIDNALFGKRFAGLPRILAISRDAKIEKARVSMAVARANRARFSFGQPSTALSPFTPAARDLTLPERVKGATLTSNPP